MGKKRLLIIVALVVVLILILALGLGLGLKKSNDGERNSQMQGFYRNGAVATDAKECSEIGRDLLKRGGHAVDAAIASLLCVGVINLHSTGIGGGGFMTIYDKSIKKSVVYNYRETAPANIHSSIYDANSTLAKVGGLAVGIPGELKGLKAAHEKYGKIPWTDLFKGAIDLATKGTRIGKHMAKYLKGKTGQAVCADPGLKEILCPNGKLKKEGDMLINKKYASTLAVIRDHPYALYNGSLAKAFIEDVNDHGGNMTEDDLKNYKPLITETLIIDSLKGLKLHTTPLPGGGSVLVHILNMAQGFNFTASDLKSLDDRVLTYHRLVESFKFSYSMRVHLGDPNTVPTANLSVFETMKDAIISKELANEHRLKINDTSTQKDSYYDPYFTTTEDDGTTHVSVLDKEGNAVAATDTINYAFGAKFRSMKTGIIFNNELADFFLKGSFGDGYPTPLFNAPLAGRRPLSSTCPTILTDNNGDVKMVVGGSGGTRITLSTAWVIVKKLLFDYHLKHAIEDPRPYHTFMPPYIRDEIGYSLADDIVAGLKSKNHVIKPSSSNAIIQGIFVDKKKIYAKSDPRKGGIAAGF